MIVGDGVYDIGLVLVAALAGYLDDDIDPGHDLQIGRASCRERVSSPV